MARIRSIKPEFWTSEAVVTCSVNARLLFVGFWNFCDDGGVHPASAARLKMEVFPGDPFSNKQVEGWLQELLTVKLLVGYEAQGQRWLAVRNWKEHQKIDKPTLRYPPPPGDASPNGRRVVAEPSPPEGKGVEGKGREGKGRESTGKDTKKVVSSDETRRGDQKDALTNGKDWGNALDLANRILRKLKLRAAGREDRSLILKCARLVTLDVFPELWLDDAVEAYDKRTGHKRRPWAFVTRCLQNKAVEDYGKDLNTLLATIKVPGWLLEAPENKGTSRGDAEK